MLNTGLASLAKLKQAHDEKEAARNRPKAEYFSWDKNKKATNPDQILVQFLQELDPAAKGYNEEKGLGIAVVEHEAPGPKGFMRRALCTMHEDAGMQCYACERRKANYEEGWKTKTNLYINALVDYNGKGNPEPVVISRNFTQSFAQQIYELAVEENTITDKVFKVTKHGSGTQTVWVLSPTSKPLFDVSDVDTFDLKETVIRDISYEDQPKYYGAVWDGTTPDDDDEDGKPAAKAASTDDVEW